MYDPEDPTLSYKTGIYRSLQRMNFLMKWYETFCHYDQVVQAKKKLFERLFNTILSCTGPRPRNYFHGGLSVVRVCVRSCVNLLL